MSKPIQHVIFDWSGVIADTFDNYYVAAMAVFAANGIPKISRSEAKRSFRQPYMEFYEQYIPGITLAVCNRIYKQAIARLPLPRPFPEMVDCIKSLNRNGINLYVISADHSITVSRELQSFGIQDQFIAVATEAYDKATAVRDIIKQYQCTPAQCLFIGDTTDEINSGKVAGCRTCAVTWGFYTKQRLQAAGPDYIAKTPKELRKIILGR